MTTREILEVVFVAACVAWLFIFEWFIRPTLPR